jgi:7-keto-8-aminopelargonate synthetase-like enzyme
MDGDIAPLKELVEIKEKYSAILMVDDAHGVGVFGERGGGCCEHFRIQDRIDIQMGTLSKAIGCLGGYISGRKHLIDFLINTARSLIFSTGLPPSVLAAASTSIDLIVEGSNLRRSLLENACFFRKGLRELGFDIGESETQIIPIIIGDEERTIKFNQKLLENGIHAPAIRPPTVPKQKSRIRVSLMANHTKGQLKEALKVFEKIGKELRII